MAVQRRVGILPERGPRPRAADSPGAAARAASGVGRRRRATPAIGRAPASLLLLGEWLAVRAKETIWQIRTGTTRTRTSRAAARNPARASSPVRVSRIPAR